MNEGIKEIKEEVKEPNEVKEVDEVETKVIEDGDYVILPSGKRIHKNSYAALKAGMFQPGQVSNPNGRPPGKSKSTIARKWLDIEEESTDEFTGFQVNLSQEDMMTLAMIKRAKKGDVKAYKELMASAYGEDKNINHTGAIGLAHITGMEIL